MSKRKIKIALLLILINVFTGIITKAEIFTHQLHSVSALSVNGIHGLEGVCPNQTGVSYTSDFIAGASSYNWSVPAGASVVSGQGTPSIVVNFGPTPGDICVTPILAAGSGVPNCLTTYLVASRPAAPDTIYGPSNTVCPGQIVTYSIIGDPIASDYIWTIPARMTVVSGLNTNSIQVLIDSGFVWGYLRAAKSNCRGISGQYVIGVYSAPTQPGSVIGPAVGACAGGTYTYSFVPVPGATSYTWYAPQGCVIASPTASGNPLTTNVSSVDITFPVNFVYGTLYITSNSGCNSSVMREMKIRSLPMKPGGIHGPFYGVCEKTGVTYFIDSVAGASSYNWSFNSNLVTIHDNGNDTITVDYLPGFDFATLCLTADNSCGSSVARCGVVFANPQIAQIIQGPTGACNSIPAVSIAYYQIDSVYGSSNYNWSVPPGATIVSGQGSTRITVDYMGASSGNVSVMSNNNCGMSPARSLSIVVNPCRVNELNEIIFNDVVSAYPNPATEEFTLNFKSEKNVEYQVRILDITGRQVLSRSHVTADGSNNEIFNVSDLPRGIYLAELNLKGNKQYVKVVVK